MLALHLRNQGGDQYYIALPLLRGPLVPMPASMRIAGGSLLRVEYGKTLAFSQRIHARCRGEFSYRLLATMQHDHKRQRRVKLG